MRKHRLAVLIALPAALWTSAGFAGLAADISGTWSFSVDVGGTHGEPTFVFKQQGEKLTGTVTNARGQQQVTGTVKGDKAAFGFDATRDGQTLKARYSGVIETPTKMTGTVEFSGSLTGNKGTGVAGTWVATKK